MKAVQVYAFGPGENLQLEDIPVPEPSENEVLIRVEAAGVIFGDVLTRLGVDPRLPEVMPYTPGMEVAGVIEKVGAGVTSLKPGARVMSYVPFGGYAEFAVASAGQVIPLPDNVSFLQGVTHLVNLPVAWLAYNVFGAVKPGDTILLHAASGGVGQLITQIAKQSGSTVIALASSQEKLDFCRENGADHLINYKTTDYVAETLRLTGGKGVDVSLNSVAGPTLETDPFAIRSVGRWAIYGYAAGREPIDPFKHFLKSLTINVSATYAYVARPEFRQAQAFAIEWIRTQPLAAPTRTFRLEEVQLAHAWLESQQSIGKTALVFDR